MGGWPLMNGEILNISPVIVWVIALSQLLTFGLTVWNLMSSGAKANARRLDEHGTRLQTHGERITQLENTVAALPGNKDLQTLTVALSDVRGDLKAIQAVINGQQEIMKRIENSVSRHEDHLRQHG